MKISPNKYLWRGRNRQILGVRPVTQDPSLSADNDRSCVVCRGRLSSSGSRNIRNLKTSAAGCAYIMTVENVPAF